VAPRNKNLDEVKGLVEAEGTDTVLLGSTSCLKTILEFYILDNMTIEL